MRGVDGDAAHLDTPGREFGADAPPERVVAHPAQPGRAMPERRQSAGHVGLGAADGEAERGLVGQRPVVRRAEHGHGLAETHDVRRRVLGGYDGRVGHGVLPQERWDTGTVEATGVLSGRDRRSPAEPQHHLAAGARRVRRDREGLLGLVQGEAVGDDR
ncbi:hypothetical protein SPURM210S_06522 [Streptomyces purpurascens]